MTSPLRLRASRAAMVETDAQIAFILLLRRYLAAMPTNNPDSPWLRVGALDALKQRELLQITVAGKSIALSFKDGKFGAVAGHCLHVGGPLGEGQLAGDAIVCPWHGWSFHRCDGKSAKGHPIAVAAYELQETDGALWIRFDTATPAQAPQREPHRLARPVKREPGPIRVVGISTTGMDAEAPRYSTSEDLLTEALAHARGALDCETRLIKLAEVKFKHCEGYYSKAAPACTWPCTLTQMDAEDELEPVYEALVHWADVVLVATPIRWGAASSLYFKMAERMNCVQNQVTLNDVALIQNKVAAFIITGGQDNVQGVAGQMLAFFSELGFTFPQFPFVAHSRGWTAEDMESNVRFVQADPGLREGARELVTRAVETAHGLLSVADKAKHIVRGGRKASGAE
jgi:nitrite reductase/ring-hydroxylating ferredoxin subunit/multimeric flavodoxin WrbA